MLFQDCRKLKCEHRVLWVMRMIAPPRFWGDFCHGAAMVGSYVQGRDVRIRNVRQEKHGLERNTDTG